MKKLLAALSALAFFLPLSAGAESPFEYAEPQAKIMVENRKLWEVPPGVPQGAVGYAVTDLDHNGRLELIVSTAGGTGLFTYSRFFEVNEAMDGLMEIILPWGLDDSQPDILGVSQWKGFYSPSENLYTYETTDFLKKDALHYEETKCVISLQGDSLLVWNQAHKFLTYDPDGTESISYYDAGGPISEEAYESAVADRFKDWKAMPVTVEWNVYHGQEEWSEYWDGLPDEARQSLLQASYSAFMGEPAVG